MIETAFDDIAGEQRLLEARREILALISHEIRTPLTSIYAYLELLADDQHLLSQRVRYVLDAVSRNTERLLKFVDDPQWLAQLDGNPAAASARPGLVWSADWVGEATEPSAEPRGLSRATNRVENDQSTHRC
jgi:signal transduction histidine kinase